MFKEDTAHKETDKQIKQLEKRLKRIYNREKKEVKAKWDEYWKYIAERIQRESDELKAAEASGDPKRIQRANDRYTDTLQIRAFYDARFKRLTTQTAEQLSHVNEIAADIINGELPKTYSVNYNFYVDQFNSEVKNISFEMVDENTVRYLAEADRSLLPYKEINTQKDIRWNEKKITAEVLQGILQGESVGEIAGRFENVLGMNVTSAIRNARTALTSAENKGRVDMMTRAENMGIKCRKVWLAASDARTRPWHRELDGKTVEKDKPFKNSIGEIMYPGDPSAAGANVYNCRCSLGYEIDGFRR